MDISPSLNDHYDYLSVHNRRFLEYVDHAPGGLKRKTYRNLFRVNTDLYSMQPWPVFVGSRALADIAEMSVNVFRLFKSIPFRVFAGDARRLRDYYRMPEGLAEYILDGVTTEDMDALMARGDFIMSPSGVQCIEYNGGTNLGGSETEMWEAAYLSVPLIQRFMVQQGQSLRNRPLISKIIRHLVETAVKRFGDTRDEINVFITVPHRPPGQHTSPVPDLYRSILANVLRMIHPGLRGSLEIGVYGDLTTRADGVYYREKRVHALLEYCTGYVPADVREVFRQNKVVIANGPMSWLMNNKLNLAVLSEHKDSDVFTPGERETIKKHIPWTRKLVEGPAVYRGESINLVDYVLANRERFVLKPVAELGGTDVCLGVKSSPDHWKERVEHALSFNRTAPPPISLGDHTTMEEWNRLFKKSFHMNQWLVQEIVESHHYLFQTGETGYEPHIAAFGFFVFGNRYSGGWTRILPCGHRDGVANACRGAQMTMLFEVDE